MKVNGLGGEQDAKRRGRWSQSDKQRDVGLEIEHMVEDGDAEMGAKYL
jgi:hypothetical protein